ncbi:MAG: hypothetical protein J7M26_04350 [Armatimonadetes bacterium]|nr:hypothetical protein [Armatimonadota bacterium]
MLILVLLMIAGLLLALILIAGVSALVPYSDLYLRGSRLAYSHLPIAAMVTLLLLAYVLAPLLRLVRLRLSPRTLAYVFALLMAVSALSSSGFVAYLFPVTVAPTHFATPENKWQQLFGRYVPEWFTPHDRAALAYFYDGLPPGARLPWKAWEVPLATWTVFAVLLIVAIAGLSAALRRQWGDHEKLVFPLVQIPLALLQAAPGGRSLRTSSAGRAVRAQIATRLGQGLVWGGAALVFVFHSINALHLYVPQVPAVNVQGIPIGAALQSRPWNALAGERLYLLPSVLGVSYLLTTEVAFSFWFFRWLWNLQRLVMAAAGFAGTGGTSIPSSLYGRYQEAGAFLVVAALALLPVLKAAPRDMEIRRALLISAAGLAGLTLWLVSAGMSLSWALAFLVMYVVISLVLGRVVAAAGVLFVECSFLPQDVLVRGFGFRSLGARNLTVLAFPEMIFMFEQQTILMPYLLQAFRLADEVSIEQRWMYVGLGLAVAVALPVAYYSALHTIYGHGAVSLDTWYMNKGAIWPFKRLQGTILNEVTRDWAAIVCALAGAGVMGLMTFLQRNFLWWPLHPLGYVMGSTYTMGVMWFSIFLGWAIKQSVQKYGGFKAYRDLRPLFVGFVVGEFVAAAFWVLVDGLAGTTGHNIFPAF